MKKHCIIRNYYCYIWVIMFLGLSLSGCFRRNRECLVGYDPSGNHITNFDFIVTDYMAVSPEGFDRTMIYTLKIVMNNSGIDVSKLSDRGDKYIAGKDFSHNGIKYGIKGGEITISRGNINVDFWSASVLQPGTKYPSYFNGNYHGDRLKKRE